MRTTPQTFLRFIAGAAVAAAVLFLVWYFRSIVVYVLISAVLAVMGNPLVKRLGYGAGTFPAGRRRWRR